LATARIVLQKKGCCVRQFILFSWISMAHVGVEEIEQHITRATPLWIDALS
jgi:hypothetical protein